MTRGVLFLCVANSARSQMAEGIARAGWRPAADPERWIRAIARQPTRGAGAG
ncbi:MAG: hypothetical protein ABI609_18505 [Acidobacteriota bacterium]